MDISFHKSKQIKILPTKITRTYIAPIAVEINSPPKRRQIETPEKPKGVFVELMFFSTKNETPNIEVIYFQITITRFPYYQITLKLVGL